MSDPAREFIARSIIAAGGIVEHTPAGIQALLPPDAAGGLGIPEELDIRLSSSDEKSTEEAPREATGELMSGGPAARGATGERVDGRIGSAFLEKLAAARLHAPPLAAVALPAGLPLPLPRGAPVLLNAVRTGEATRTQARCRYLALDLRVALHADELRSELVKITIRLDDGARTERLGAAGAYAIAAVPLDSGEIERTHASLRSWLRRDAPAVHATALDALRRRARRDLERLAEYYRALDAEMLEAVGRARSESERQRRTAKWQRLPQDLDNRRNQVRMRFQPRLSASVIGATIVLVDVERFELPVRRRRRAGTVTVRSRLADGVFEGPGCATCGGATLRLYLCDDRLHPLCDACGQAGKLDASRCPACAKAAAEPEPLAIVDPTATLR